MHTVIFSCTTARMFYILILRITVHLLRMFYITGTHYCTVYTNPPPIISHYKNIIRSVDPSADRADYQCRSRQLPVPIEVTAIYSGNNVPLCSETTHRLSAGQTNEETMSVSMPHFAAIGTDVLSILPAIISNFDIDTYLNNFSQEISFSVANNTVE